MYNEILLLLFSHSVMSHSLWPHGLWPTRLLCPCNFSGKNTGVDCLVLLQGPSQPKDWTCISWISGIGGQVLYHEHHLEVPGHKILIAKSEGIFSSFSKILDFAFSPAVILMVTIWNTLFCVPWGHWVIKLSFESIEWRSVGRLLLWDILSYSSSSSSGA